MEEALPIIDSHIHLFPSSEIQTCAWHRPGHALDAQHSLEEYRAATHRQSTQLRGFVFVETDRISHCENESGWNHALDEVSWLTRIATGRPKPGEGHEAFDAALCLAIVPWAPMPSGAQELAKYVSRVRERTGEAVARKVTGFRYLLQDKPRGTMLEPRFVDSLRWLGCNGYCFDLGVDQRSGGLWQLDEAIEVLQRANEGVHAENQVVIVINHLCKPDMLTAPFAPANSNANLPSFRDWRDRMTALAAFPNTYMKLSGSFSEIEALPTEDKQRALEFWDRHDLLARTTEHIRSWVSEVLRLWGPSRCMFGSDWPVSNIGGGGNSVGWMNWRSVVGDIISPLSREDQALIWAGTAERVYKIS